MRHLTRPIAKFGDARRTRPHRHAQYARLIQKKRIDDNVGPIFSPTRNLRRASGGGARDFFYPLNLNKCIPDRQLALYFYLYFTYNVSSFLLWRRPWSAYPNIWTGCNSSSAFAGGVGIQCQAAKDPFRFLGSCSKRGRGEATKFCIQCEYIFCISHMVPHLCPLERNSDIYGEAKMNLADNVDLSQTTLFAQRASPPPEKHPQNNPSS